MNPYSLSQHFSNQPLTPHERSRGRCLRLALCLRSGEGVFEDGPASWTWVVLAGARMGERLGRPRCLGFFGPGRSPLGARPVDLGAGFRHEVLLDDGAWDVVEYDVTLPAHVEQLVLFGNGCRLVAGGGVTGPLREAYGARIANASVDAGYPAWLERQREVLGSREVPAPGPLMSIVTPAYRTPPRLLDEMIASVAAQTYARWELVLVNASPEDAAMRKVLRGWEADPRIRVIDQPENLGIVGNTNLGIAACAGEYVSFFDHDDVIEPQALAEFVRAIEACGVKRPGMLYCDEDNIDEHGAPRLPLLKPDFNPDLLLNDNYIIHWLTVRRDLLERVQLSAGDVEGAQDYDLTFKVTELDPYVVHVPHVLYHWRIHSGSTAGDPGQKSYAQDAGTHAIAGHLRRTGARATVRRGKGYFIYETSFAVPAPAPALTVLCAGECSAVTRAAVEEYCRAHGARVRFVGLGASPVEGLRAFAEEGGRRAAGVGVLGGAPSAELALLVSPAVDVDAAALETLVANACRREVFAVSPKVVRGDGLLDYAGMLVHPDGSLGRLLRYLPVADGGYVGRTQRPYDASCLNAECCLVDVAELGRLGVDAGFNTVEHALADACIRARTAGLLNVYMPYAEVRLGEVRPFMADEPSPEAREDARLLIERHPEYAAGDPSHNPNFDPWSLYYKLGQLGDS